MLVNPYESPLGEPQPAPDFPYESHYRRMFIISLVIAAGSFTLSLLINPGPEPVSDALFALRALMILTALAGTATAALFGICWAVSASVTR